MDLDVPIVIGGTNYGAPIKNLEAALRAEGLDSVDLWIGTGGLEIARLVLPVIKPKAYLPVHWDGLWGAFEAGVPQPYSDPPLEAFLAKAGVQLLKPTQYGDKWRLDRTGVRPVTNDSVKQALAARGERLASHRDGRGAPRMQPAFHRGLLSFAKGEPTPR